MGLGIKSTKMANTIYVFWVCGWSNILKVDSNYLKNEIIHVLSDEIIMICKLLKDKMSSIYK